MAATLRLRTSCSTLCHSDVCSRACTVCHVTARFKKLCVNIYRYIYTHTYIYLCHTAVFLIPWDEKWEWLLCNPWVVRSVSFVWLSGSVADVHQGMFSRYSRLISSATFFSSRGKEWNPSIRRLSLAFHVLDILLQSSCFFITVYSCSEDVTKSFVGIRVTFKPISSSDLRSKCPV